MKPKPSANWKLALLPLAVGLSAGLLAMDARLAVAWRVVSVAALLAVCVWLLTLGREVEEVLPAPASEGGPTYALPGNWQPGFASWLRNGIEEALRAVGMRPAKPGEPADLAVWGPGGRGPASRLEQPHRGFVVCVRVGEGLPDGFDRARARDPRLSRCDALIHVARRGAEVRAYLVAPGGEFSLVPNGPSDDAFFASLRQEMLARLPRRGELGRRAPAV